MKYRIFAIIVLGIISLAAVFGLYKKQTYTDVAKFPGYINSFAVAQLSEKMAIEECEKLEKILPESPIILKVYAVEPIEHLFKISRQKVQIDTVYTGSDLNTGDYIYITSNRWKLNTTGEPPSIERGFVNVMKEGDAYLVFLTEKMETLDNEEIPVYRIVEESVLLPVFSFDEHENTVAEIGEYQHSSYVQYEKVKDNEFFAATEGALNAMLELKQKLISVVKACENTVDNEENVNAELLNIREMDEKALIEAMNFNDYTVSVLYNTNDQVPLNRTVDIYGVVMVSNDEVSVKDTLTNRFSEIRLYDQKRCIITSKEYSVDTIALENGILFTLHLVIDNEPDELQTYNIDEIQFVHSFGVETKNDIDRYWLTVYREEKNKINIIESPSSNAIDIEKDEYLWVSYLFLNANPKSKNDFTVSFDLPFKDAVDASIMEIEVDEEMTEEVQTQMYYDLTVDQRESLKVYEILYTILGNDLHLCAAYLFK